MKNVAGLLAALAALAFWAPVTRAQTEVPPTADPQPATEDPGAAGGTKTDEPGDDHGGRMQGGGTVRERANRNRNVVLLEAFREETKRVLQADEETNGYIDEIFAEHVAALEEEGGDVAEERREQANEMRELVSEMRDAQRDGDTERAAQLREKITALRTHASDEQNVDLVQLQSEMREVLDDDQFERFMAIERKYEPRFSRSKDSSAQALQRMRQVLATLDLSDEQKDRTRELIVEHSQSIRRLRGDEAKAAEAVKALHDAIVGQLDEKQAEDFERKLTEAEQRETAGPVHRRAPGQVPAPTAAPVDEEHPADGAAEGEAEGDVTPPE